jgi:GNAT superfamily N-acetyltransferase
LETTSFRQEHIPEAAALFVQNFRRLRQKLPIVPDRLDNPAVVAEHLSYLLDSAVAAMDGGILVGYLGWFVVDRFRESERLGAYVPEWGHVAADGQKLAIYRALYRTASTRWADEGCRVHAVTILADDHEAEKSWFWSGFGMTVVDAVRTMDATGILAGDDFTVRQATPDDTEMLAVLDAEHWQHYSQPPVFMARQQPNDAATLVQFLNNPDNRIWLALCGSDPIGFMRFEGRGCELPILSAESTVAITGAYTRPAYRGRRAAGALLAAGLRDYADQGYQRCAVDFESFNPEAAAFWMKYFDPVCLSLLRVPENSA